MATTPLKLYCDFISSVSRFTKGTWTSTAGGSDANVISVLKDGSDSTYINRTGSGAFSRLLHFETPTIPNGARVISIQQRIRAKTNGSPGSYMHSYIWIPLTNNLSNPARIERSRVGTFVDYRASSTFNSTKINSHNDGSELTHSQLSLLYVYWATVTEGGRNYWAETSMRVSEIWLELHYDEKPVVSNVTPTVTGNTVYSDTLTPLITWDYQDDWQPQSGYQVQILNAATNDVIYDSFEVSSGDTSHQVNASLAGGIQYRVRVRARQAWSGKGGGFWGDWSYSAGTFSLTVIPAARPGVFNFSSSENGYNVVKSIPYLNLLTYDEASFENGFLSWGQGGSPNTGATLSSNSNASYIVEGFGSLKVTQTAAQTLVQTRTMTAVEEGKEYVFGIQHKVDSATTVGTLAITAGIVWFDENGNYLGEAEGDATAGDKTSFVRCQAVGVAPNGARLAKFYFHTSNTGANGKIFYVDSAVAFLSFGADDYINYYSRGGMGADTPNLLSRADSTLDQDFSGWAAGNGNTAVVISATQARQGITSLRLTRSASTGQVLANLTGSPITPPDPTDPKKLSLFASFYPATGVNLVAFGVNWYDASNVLVTNSEMSFNSGAITSGAWNDKQDSVVEPTNTNISYGVPYVYFNNVASTNVCYADAFSIVRTEGTAMVGFQPGYEEVTPVQLVIEALDIPGFPVMTQAEFSNLAISNPVYRSELIAMTQARYDEAAAGVVDWQEVFRGDADTSSSHTTFNDRSAQSGIARLYRSYTYRYERGALITSRAAVDGYDEYLCPVTISFQDVWLSTVDQKVDLVNGGLVEDDFSAYHFRFPQTGHSETYAKEATTFKLAGREFPVVSFGETTDASVSVTLLLPTEEDAAGFREIAERRSLVIYRNGTRVQRVKGLLQDIQYTYNQATVQVSFQVVAAGQQYE